MLLQIDNIIYNVVYHNMLSNDLFNEFNNIINELNNDNNTNTDIKNKAIKLNLFLRKCGIKPLDIYLEPNDIINKKISLIIGNDIFKNNILLNQDVISNSAYKTIIKYIILNETTEIDKDKLYDIEPITDDEMSLFITSFNNMIELKTLISILNFIFTNSFISYYNKLIDDKFSLFDIPINIYNSLNNEDVLNSINTLRYKDIYSTLLTLLKKDDDKEYIEYFKLNISNIDIKEGIKDVFLKKQINVDKDLFKTNKLTVTKFLENILNLDIITNELFINWNKLLSDILLSLNQKSENLEDSINEIKETLNALKITVVIGKDDKTNKLQTTQILCKDVFKLFFTNIKTLDGHDIKDGEKDNLSIGEHIINELQLLFDTNLNKLKIQIINKDNSFFKSFKLLLSTDNKEILSFFDTNLFKVEEGTLNIFDIYKIILDYISNNKPYEWLSSFYSLMYFISKIKIESILYYRNNDIYLFEDELENTENLIDKAHKYIEKEMGTNKSLIDLADSLYKNNEILLNPDKTINTENKETVNTENIVGNVIQTLKELKNK